jgi:hypothetical protein
LASGAGFDVSMAVGNGRTGRRQDKIAGQVQLADCCTVKLPVASIE